MFRIGVRTFKNARVRFWIAVTLDVWLKGFAIADSVACVDVGS